MKNGWVALQKDTWLDRDFLRLSSDAKVVFLWSWSNPVANTAGLYSVSREEIARGTGLDHGQVRAALRELADKPMVVYDAAAQMLWVVNRARHVATTPKGQAAVLAAYARQPDGQLTRLWYDRYQAQLGLA